MSYPLDVSELTLRDILRIIRRKLHQSTEIKLTILRSKLTCKSAHNEGIIPKLHKVAYS